MKTVLSLAIWMVRPGGRSRWMLGSSARSAWASVSGLAVACLTMPTDTALRPLSRTTERSWRGAMPTRAMSRIFTGKPLTVLTTTSSNSAGRCRSVCETTVNSRCELSMRPEGISTFCRRSASSTSCGVSR